MREPYKLSEEEIQILLQGIISYGEDITYSRMQEKTFGSLEQVEYMDEMVMDMHDTMLDRARNYEIADEADEDYQIKLYQLASMLRFIAHDAHHMLKSKGRVFGQGRFLELANYSEDIPARTWHK